MSDQPPGDQADDDPRRPEDATTDARDSTDGGIGRPVSATVTSDGERIVVVTPDGMGVAPHPGSTAGDPPSTEGGTGSSRGDHTNPADLVEQPAKVMRIGSMVKQLLEEVRSAPLDERGRARLADVHERSLAELKGGLAPELVEELERIALPFREDTPSDAELRIAQAQLVGWLEGLFHGIQTALVAQQMAAQAQLQQMRALPPGVHPPGDRPFAPGRGMAPHGAAESSAGPADGTGQYL
jgi:hypothetical protein